MKNYDEITNDLLERRDQFETEQRNRRKVMKRVVTPICCFCLVALLGIGLWQGGFFNSKPPITVDDSTIIGEKDWIDEANVEKYKSVVLLSSANKNLQVKNIRLQKETELSLQYNIEVTDIRNLGQNEIENIVNKKKEQLRNQLAEVGIEENDSGVSHGAVDVRENVIITSSAIGTFLIESEDYSKIKSINVKNSSEFGQVELVLLSNSIDIKDRFPHGTNITIDGDVCSKFMSDMQQEKGHFEINWRHSLKVKEQINENPNIDLSEFNDSMVITIEYSDGSIEVTEIDIKFNKDGSLFILPRGTTQTT